ncbi:cold shock domain-containing protein [Streptomyces sp. NP-1717]|uniref:cold shock domain-containing protein n=1 Tax=unclassified Streptomyces TaxID=2593676 RepID=UPI001F5D61F1|nr:cold shock domain-containing protein [Streptomyces sp. NP-1717]MCI3222075.1 cold shock domain-containing protein [Streptomyces sp. NP-1717]WTA71968.1 cold shock domain-containing protein [Streptomyces sp. NBC_00838]
MLHVGRVLRFDEVRGYGFIVPSEGDEDVFMHANDLLDEKYQYKAGSEVEYFLEVGDKGPKASQIRLVHAPAPQSQRGGSGGGQGQVDPHGEYSDVLSPVELRNELTEALLQADGTLTGDQIKRVRTSVIELARTHGWLES